MKKFLLMALCIGMMQRAHAQIYFTSEKDTGWWDIGKIILSYDTVKTLVGDNMGAPQMMWIWQTKTDTFAIVDVWDGIRSFSVFCHKTGYDSTAKAHLFSEIPFPFPERYHFWIPQKEVHINSARFSFILHHENGDKPPLTWNTKTSEWDP